MVGKYDRLARWLVAQDTQRIELSFDEIEQILGGTLPKSGRVYPAFWSSGNHAGHVLLAAGWRASLLPPKVLFSAISGEPHRYRSRVISPRGTGEGVGWTQERAEPRALERSLGATLHRPDLVLVGCVKRKRFGHHAARDLYTSPLFTRRRQYAEASGCPWFILSAKYGLVEPSRWVETYDVSLKDLSVSERRQWSQCVFLDLERKFGPLSGRVIEIHAGADYVGHGLEEALCRRGAIVRVPTRGLRLGEQLAFYDQRVSTRRLPSVACAEVRRPETGDAGDIVARLTHEFTEGVLDLRARPGAPRPGWDGMPEFAAAKQLAGLGVRGGRLRVFLTLVAALDRARDADRLWSAAARLYAARTWVFHPVEVAGRRPDQLREALATAGVSQRHGQDVKAWYRICQALSNPGAARPVYDAVFNGRGDAHAVLRAVHSKDACGQPWFPLLSGPKISVVWVRLLVAPGGARLERLDVVPVAVDVQVRKASEKLGVVERTGGRIESVREEIQTAWRRGAHRAVGPPGLEGTCAAIDPALWFLGKWGCSFCERWRRRSPIAGVCRWCRMEGSS